MVPDVLMSLFSGVVLWRALYVSNHMSKHTCHFIRFALVALAAAALGLLFAPFYPHSTDVMYARVIFVFAVALYMIADRRERKPQVSLW